MKKLLPIKLTMYLLAALFFHHAPEAGRQSSRRRTKSSDDNDSGSHSHPSPPVYTIPPENQANPFASSG